MFKLIKEGELKFPEKPAVSPEAKDFITKVNKQTNKETHFTTKK